MRDAHSASNPLSPDRMTAAERLAEIAQILAAALIRIRRQKSSSLSAPPRRLQLTARSIDRGALLEEISQAAAMERVHQLAAILFEAEQEKAQPSPDREINLETFISSQIRQLRDKLPDGSKTAKAIDRGATWEEISESAQEEGLGNMAAMLFEAEQEKARDPT